MRITVTLDDDLFNRAKEETGIQKKAELLHAGLEALLTQRQAGGWLVWAALNLN